MTHMDRNEMIKILKGIKGNLLTEYGAFDTGIEFEVLSSAGVASVRSPGDWPIEGPLGYSEDDDYMGRMLLEIDFEGDGIDEEELIERVENSGLEPLSEDWVEKITALDDQDLHRILLMASHDCDAGHAYYIFDDGEEASVHASREAALQVYLGAYAGDLVPWEELDDEKLDEYVEITASLQGGRV